MANISGKRIVLTSSKDSKSSLKEKLEGLGAEVLHLPLIDIEPKTDPKIMKEVWAEFGTYQWIIFTSMNGVENFFHYFFKRFEDIRYIGGLRIACVGPSTAEALKKYYLNADFIPQVHESEALANELIAFETLEHEKILVITGNLNGDSLVNILSEKGSAIVDMLQVYENKNHDLSKSSEAEAFQKKGADVIVFMSSSAAESFAKQAKELSLEAGARVPKTLSIGPKTTAGMKANKIPVDAQAANYDADGIVEAIGKLCSK